MNRWFIRSVLAILILAVLFIPQLVAPRLQPLVHATLVSSQKVALVPNANGQQCCAGVMPTTGSVGGTSLGFGDFEFTNLPVASVNAANLAPYDTLVLLQVNTSSFTAQQRTDINNFVDSGHKLIIYDSDATAGTDYSWLLRTFTTFPPCPNCGLPGGTLTIIENNTLGSNDAASPKYIKTNDIPPNTDAVGDANVMATSDPNWFGHMRATNARSQTGWTHAYAESPSGKGALVYNGIDTNFIGGTSWSASGIDWLAKIWYLELKQQWDPTGLPGTTPVAGQILLSPLSASLTTGQTHTLSATVTDTTGTLLPGVSVTFTTTGANSRTGSATTNAAGKASFSYTGSTAGRDSIVASATIDGKTVTSNVVHVDWTVPPRQIVFVHGINGNFREILAGNDWEALIGPLINDFGASNIQIFPYYQDKGYRNAGQCPGMPAPDERTGPLFMIPNSIDPNICDSKGALAYSATELDRSLSKISVPTAIIANSMGGAITRGWLTLAQSRSNLRNVDTLTFLEGSQQGSYLGEIGEWLNITLSDPLLNMLTEGRTGAVELFLTTVATLADYDPNRPGINDVSAESKWYGSVNPTNVPSQLHYFNFYTDIQVSTHGNFIFYKLPTTHLIDLGDVVHLKGTPNPTDIPRFGGARFLPGNSTAPDRYEFSIIRSYDPPVSQLPKTIKFIIFDDPANHFNFSKNVGNGAITVASCQTGGGVTPLQQIVEILHDPAHVCKR